jgi:signal transduction histidine kinase
MGMRMTAESPAPARDRRVWLAWAGFGFALATWLATLVGYVVLQPDTSGDWGGASIVANLPFLVMVLAFDVIGMLITTRRPGNAIGWLVLGIGLAWSAGDVLSAVGQYGFDHGWSDADVLIAVSQPTWLPPIGLTGTFLILLFPDGHLPSPRWRWFAWTIAVGMSLVGIAFLVAPGTFGDSGFPKMSNPLGIEAMRPFLGVVIAGLLIIPIGMLGSMVSLVQRYRRSAGVERQQMKWLAYAAAVAACTYAAVMVASILEGNGAADPPWLVLWQNLSLAALALIPITIGVAVLKYRLYDIDVVINKTIVFGALAAFIGAVYVAVVVLLGAAIGATTTSPALSIAATAIVALLFEPVRVRVQRVANRFVYGERATPYEVLSRFSDRIAGTYATEDVLPRTARVIAEGTGAERVAVWLRVGDELVERGSWPAAEHATAPVPMAGGDLPAFSEGDATVPILYREEVLGAVTVTKPRGEAMTPAEGALLDDLAGQAGLVLSNVRLTAELQARLDEIARRSQELKASRQRIVTTQDAERRRLERNIHDGAQQHLVALAVKLRLVRGMLAKDPDRAATMLGELRIEVDEAIETLSSLALGIYPPVLEEHGIAAAIESQARIGSILVAVVADGVDRQPIETEAAVYFCCLEAIQNAAKHAEAARIDVRLGHEGANLTFEVRDDGIGFDTAAAGNGSGLQGMADRLSALGGSVTITSTPGSGTVVSGRVPAVVFA